MPRTPVTLGGILAASLLFPAFASAAPERISDGVLIDASSDGRYVLVDTPDGSQSLLDRTAGTTTKLDDFAYDVAADAPRVLASGDGLLVHDLAAGTKTTVNVDNAGESIGFDRAVLVRNGRSVIFDGSDPETWEPAILERNLDTGKTTIRVSGASLRHASEDGRIITWMRSLPNETRPAGTAPIAGEPASVSGLAVGYSVDGGPPRLLARSSWKQIRIGDTSGQCTDGPVDANVTTPVDLRVSQEGDAGGRYLLTLSTRKRTAGYPHEVLETTRFGQSTSLLGTTTESASTELFTDPVSPALLKTTTIRGAALWNTGAVTDSAGSEWDVTYPAPAGPSTDTLGLTRRGIPVQNGGGLIYSGTPRATGESGVYEDLGRSTPTGAPTGDWTALPRTAHVLDSASQRIDAEWVDCNPPAALPRGSFSDYVTLTTFNRGPRSGTATIRFAPQGKLAVTSATVRTSWFGIQISSKTLKAPGTITLPSIVPYLPGYRAEVRVNFPAGSPLVGGATLWRAG